MTGLWEAHPNCCDTPSNRGASNTDRSSWAAAVDTSGLSCIADRDATTEEILHLITEAAAAVWPNKWGKDYSSSAGTAIQSTHGDCGNGVTGDFQDPSGGAHAFSIASRGVDVRRARRALHLQSVSLSLAIVR